MPVRAGAPFTAVIGLARQNTGARIPGATVYLQRLDPSVGDYTDVATAPTGQNGEARIQANFPSTPGVYRYRSRWDGTRDLRPDTSPPERVEVT